MGATIWYEKGVRMAMDLQTTTDEIKKAIGAHGTWKLTLSTAARTGGRDLDVNQISASDACAFGQWLQSVAPHMAGDVEYARIKKMHATFHSEAGRLAALIQSGQTDAALADLGEGGDFTSRSKELSEAMADWRMALRRAAQH